MKESQTTAHALRELITSQPMGVQTCDLVEWAEIESTKIGPMLQSLERGGFINHPSRGFWTISKKGMDRVLKVVPKCEVCNEGPTVGVRLFEESDPVTTRVLCKLCSLSF